MISILCLYITSFISTLYRVRATGTGQLGSFTFAVPDLLHLLCLICILRRDTHPHLPTTTSKQPGRWGRALTGYSHLANSGLGGELTASEVSTRDFSAAYVERAAIMWRSAVKEWPDLGTRTLCIRPRRSHIVQWGGAVIPFVTCTAVMFVKSMDLKGAPPRRMWGAKANIIAGPPESVPPIFGSALLNSN